MASGEATTLRRRTVLEIECQDSTTLARTGLLLGHVATPALVAYTEYGSLPYLTQDLLCNMRDQHGSAFGLLHLDLATCLDLADVKSSRGQRLEDVACLPGGLVTCLAPRDLLTSSAGSCGAKAISLDTTAGRRNLTLPDYVKLLRTTRPGLSCAITDEVPCSASRTRHGKAHNKTLQLLDDLIKARAAAETGEDDWCPLLGAVVGGTHEDLRRRSARELLLRKEQLDGYYVAGLGLGETANERAEILRAVMSELPPEGPRLVAGLQTPIEIVQAVELGVDLISSAFPFTLVRTGHALVFPLTEEAVNMAAEEARQARKRRRVERGLAKPSSEAGEEAEGAADADGEKDEEEEEGDGDANDLINLWDDVWSRDRRPLLEGCECAACSGRHSRAYIHHLLLAHEILGEELLHIHNLHHYLCFFRCLRASVKEGKLQQYKQHIQRVCGDPAADHETAAAADMC